jgi:hypothetical protein
MVFKVNYNQQRAERDRAKQAKKEAKAREREEEVARRKAGLSAEPDTAAADETAPEARDGTP